MLQMLSYFCNFVLASENYQSCIQKRKNRILHKNLALSLVSSATFNVDAVKYCYILVENLDSKKESNEINHVPIQVVHQIHGILLTVCHRGC
jgi:hypothetical protein